MLTSDDGIRRVRRANTDFFEELGSSNFERECIKESCSTEEFTEILENHTARSERFDRMTFGSKLSSVVASSVLY